MSEDRRKGQKGTRGTFASGSRIYLLLVLLTLVAGGRLYYTLTDDFRLSAIQHDPGSQPQWTFPEPTPAEQAKLEAVLAQPFHYLGKGAQSYAFLSEDGNYVIKFFKFKHLRPEWYWRFVPFKTLRQAKRLEKKCRLHNLFSGYSLAYQRHRKESGLLYLRLALDTPFEKEIILYDKLGFKRTLSLDSVSFVVQQRAKTTRQVLADQLNVGDLEGAKAHLRQIIDLYAVEYQKGIYDRDHGVMHNTGFIADRPIHLDVGKLTRDTAMQNWVHARPDLDKVAWKIAEWLERYYPEQTPQLVADLEIKVTEVTRMPFSFASLDNPFL